MEASMLMTLEVTTIPPELSLEQAHQLMIKLGARHLPVVSGGKLAGIVSDRDILLKIGQEKDGRFVYPDQTVGEVMTLAPISAGVNASVAELAKVMIGKKIDALPIVTRENELIGLVTSSDLLALVSALPTERQPMLSFQVRRVGPGARA